MNSYAFRNDRLFLRNGLEQKGNMNFPLIRNQEIRLENISIMPYNLTKPCDKKNSGCGIHFFIDDYRFESVYQKPYEEFLKLKNYTFLLSPDFSLYAEMPLWRQIESVAKNRWCGAYWQYKGQTVIPTVSWGLAVSFDFCFEGLEEGGVYAVSPIGCHLSKRNFMKGYDELLKRLKPAAILCLGKAYEEMKGNVVAIRYSRTNKVQSCTKISENLGRHLFTEVKQPFLPFEDFICFVKLAEEDF